MELSSYNNLAQHRMCSFLFFLNHSTLLDRAVRQGLDRLELVPGLADMAWTGWSWGQGWQTGPGQVGAGHDGAGQAGQGGSVLGTINRS